METMRNNISRNEQNLIRNGEKYSKDYDALQSLMNIIRGRYCAKARWSEIQDKRSADTAQNEASFKHQVMLPRTSKKESLDAETDSEKECRTDTSQKGSVQLIAVEKIKIAGKVRPYFQYSRFKTE